MMQLFLGAPVEGALEQLDSALFSAFDLQTIPYKSKTYLGKSLGALSEIAKIELSEAHLQSLLKRLLPETSFTLYLIPISHDS